MSKYTTQVRFICEERAGYEESQGYEKVNEIIEKARGKIFNFDYEIFDEEYRPILEKKILKHYYTREICEETFGLWQLRLDARMNDIMPFYNQLYKSELIKFNPMYDVDLTTTHDKQGTEIGNNNSYENENGSKAKNENSYISENENRAKSEAKVNKTKNNESESNSENTVTSSGTTNKGSENNDNTNWKAYSDTPQGSLQNVDNGTYLTNATKTTDDGSTKNENVENQNIFEVGDGSKQKDISEENSENSNGLEMNDKNVGENKNSNEVKENERERKSNRTINNMEDYFEHIVGKRGSMTYSKMLDEFRKTFLNIDKMVIDELADLFFLLW